jgi:hypothetical protein
MPTDEPTLGRSNKLGRDGIEALAPALARLGALELLALQCAAPALSRIPSLPPIPPAL